jgi:diaminopimelate epimerase
MHPLAGRKVTKMNGLGNKIAILDLRGADLPLDAPMVRAIGRSGEPSFDQLMVLRDPRTRGTEAYVQIYNSDGSEAEACGNGTRCVAWLLLRDEKRDTLTIETMAGKLQSWRHGPWTFAVDMGRPHFGWTEIPLSEPVPDTGNIALSVAPDQPPLVAAAVNMGNPHAVIFVDDLAAHNLQTIGPALEHNPLFPERANISLAQVMAPDHIVVQVWERGAGITEACGSAACAVVVAAAQKDLSARKAVVSLPGGDLTIDWRDDDHVVMQGPVEWEAEVRLDAALFAGLAA